MSEDDLVLDAEARRRLRHDLRTPLTIVAGFAEVLAGERDISEADRREFAQRIQDAANEIRKLIDDVFEDVAPRGQLLLLALGRDLDHVPGQLHPPHRADHPPRRIEPALPAAQAVERRARERVVVVVPGLAHREQGEPGDVGGVIVDGEPAAAEEVADGVDRPRDVVDEEDPHRAAPQRRLERAAPGAGEREADRRAGSRSRAPPTGGTSCG